MSETHQSVQTFKKRFEEVKTSERPLHDVHLRDAYMSQEYRDLVETMQHKHQQVWYVKAVNGLSGAYFRSKYRELETADMMKQYREEIQSFRKTAPQGTMEMNRISQRYEVGNGGIRFMPSPSYKMALRQEITLSRSVGLSRNLDIYD